ncbi:MAG: YcxB family protein [Verrucomicrobia subdivision 3 bacterium]|nr:YcxB family protein [Limisphaerales bacterium]
MTVEFDLTKDDLIAFNLYHNSHSTAVRRQYLIGWFLPAAILLAVCIGIWMLADQSRNTPLRTFLDLLPLFCSVPLFLLYYPWAYRRKVRKIIDAMVSEGSNRGLFGRHAVSISEIDITDSGAFGQTTRVWFGVERVVGTEHYAYIYLSSLSAVIVPRRAFVSEAEFEKFIEQANDYHANAGPISIRQ